MNAKLKAVYDRTPVFVQNWVLSGYGLVLHRQRFTGGYSAYRDLLDRMQWSTPDEIAGYQNETLAAVVRHAYDTVPFYRRRFKRLNLKPSDVTTREDLPKLPLLTKDDIKKNYDDLVSSSFEKAHLATGHTSGTTGSPLTVAYDQPTTWVTYAALDRQYEWAGCRFGRRGDRTAVARGNPIVPLGQKKPPFWRHNRFHNQFLLSSFHLSDQNLGVCFEAMERFDPVVLDGYPSTLYILAKYLLNHGKVFPLRAVISSSETLYDFQRDAVEEAFQCRLFDYYALAERTVFSCECDRHEGHHLCEEYGITEFVDGDGEPVAHGNPGRLVSTGLHNRAMPLIRYVTNDVTALKTGLCSCGRGLRLVEDVTTKAEDTLTLRDGRLISPSALTHPFKPLDSIIESQIVQKDYDHIQIKIVPGPEYDRSDEQHLISEMAVRIGTDTRIEIEIVDEIPRLPNGKFRWVISEVPFGLS